MARNIAVNNYIKKNGNDEYTKYVKKKEMSIIYY